MTTRVTARLPAELLNQAKRKAASEGRTLSSLIEEGVRAVVAPTQAAKAARTFPPVSSAQGGLLPGVDIANNAALQEADDVEYIERMRCGFR